MFRFAPATDRGLVDTLVTSDWGEIGHGFYNWRVWDIDWESGCWGVVGGW